MIPRRFPPYSRPGTGVGLIRSHAAAPFSELRDKMDVHFVDSDILQARKEALRLLKEGEAEALLDTGPLDSGFFSLLMESDVQIARSIIY